MLAEVWKLGEIKKKNTLGKEDVKYRELPRNKKSWKGISKQEKRAENERGCSLQGKVKL